MCPWFLGTSTLAFFIFGNLLQGCLLLSFFSFPSLSGLSFPFLTCSTLLFLRWTKHHVLFLL